MENYSVVFQPDNIRAIVNAGTDLMTAAQQAKIEIKCGCGGEGTCGKCLVRIVSGQSESDNPELTGLAVACRTRVAGDMVVEIPVFSRLTRHQVLMDDAQCDVAGNGVELPPRFAFDPLSKRANLQLTPPSLTDPSSDACRLLTALRRTTGREPASMELEQVKKLATVLRDSKWNVDVTYATTAETVVVTGVAGHNQSVPLWGIAVDVGTTTVVVYLVDLLTGEIAGKVGNHNRQARFGDDVITRIMYASEEEQGLDDLQQAVVETINGLVKALVRKYDISAGDIKAVVTAGNTTMAHLLLGIHPRFIRLEPYVPAASHFPMVKAKDIGLEVDPGAVVYSFPAVASYVGGDIVAGVLINGMAVEEPVTLFLDIGTNGEMVLGNREWLVSCSCSAGPAFEGGGITHGMRAMRGAIERLEIDPETFAVNYSTIGNMPPIGICGSGLIDALAKLRKAGIIDRAGKMQDVSTPRVRNAETGPEFVLAWAAEGASGSDIVITEADVKNLLRAKGAVYAGVRSLLKAVAMDMDSIERVYIAGGFGSYLNIADAVEIGLLPDLPAAEYRFLGNTAVKGAYAVLTAASALQAAEQLADHITYVELSAGNQFMEEFVSALFLPHTDLALFPSVQD